MLQAGYVAHELGHALGLFHEHQRPDRDDYINVVRDNIKAGQESNFSPVNPSFIEYLDVPYDLSSDMHYRAAVSFGLCCVEKKEGQNAKCPKCATV